MADKVSLPIATTSQTRTPVKEQLTAQQRFYIWICFLIVAGVVGSVFIVANKF